MENHRSIKKQSSGRVTSESGVASLVFRVVLLQILSFVKYSQAVPFLWIVLGSALFVSFSFAPEPTGMALLLVIRLLLIEQPNSVLQGNVSSEIVSMAFSRLFLLFTVLLYLSGTILKQFGIELLRGFRRKVIALIGLCLAVFFILNICYSLAEVPFNGPYSEWRVLFLILTIALFITGFWAICVREIANQIERILLPSTSAHTN